MSACGLSRTRRAVVREPLVVLELRTADDATDVAPAAIEQHGDGEVLAVAAGVGVPEGRRAAARESLRGVAAEESRGDVEGLQRHDAAEQRDVDLLALAGAFAVQERGADAECGEHAAHLIGDGRAGVLGHAVRVAGDVHQAAAGLAEDVEAALLRFGALRAVAGRSRVDDARVRRSTCRRSRCRAARRRRGGSSSGRHPRRGRGAGGLRRPSAA